MQTVVQKTYNSTQQTEKRHAFTRCKSQNQIYHRRFWEVEEFFFIYFRIQERTFRVLASMFLVHDLESRAK